MTKAKANLTPDERLAGRPTLPPSARDSRTDTEDTWSATQGAREVAFTRETFLKDLEVVSRHVTAEIDNDPKEVAKLRRSIKQAEEGQRRPYRSDTERSS